MTEVPKDGRNYLACHKHYGLGFIFHTHDYFVSLTQKEDTYVFCNYNFNDVFISINLPLVVERWMDEKGQWHEVSEHDETR